MADPVAAQPADAPEPDPSLPPCPDTPNCVRTAQVFDAPVDTVFDAALHALDALGPEALETTPEAHRAHAVYRVALVFKDDVDLVVTPVRDGETPAGSRLQIRSASRVGYSDLGVNKRRVQRFFRTLAREV